MLTAEMIRQLMRGNREQIALQRTGRIVIRQARQKADECFLNGVFRGVAAAESRFDERQQPTLESSDQLLPCVDFPRANAIDQQRIRSWHTSVRLSADT